MSEFLVTAHPKEKLLRATCLDCKIGLLLTAKDKYCSLCGSELLGKMSAPEEVTEQTYLEEVQAEVQLPRLKCDGCGALIYSNSEEPDWELDYLLFCPECGDAEVLAFEDTKIEDTKGGEKENPEIPTAPIILRYRGARDDARIRAIRRKIEAGFRLPEGSVALCGPDGKKLYGHAKIATLRKRWK
jgi:Zn finger protein HypA/HybF involved in hydrogenase expression